MCGEQGQAAHAIQDCNGSSPRVQGTAKPQRRVQLNLRFIPACAGNRFFQFTNCFNVSVHPRVCGEQMLIVSL